MRKVAKKMENGGAKVMMKNASDDPMEESKELGRANWDQIAMSMSHKISSDKKNREENGPDDELGIMAADP